MRTAASFAAIIALLSACTPSDGISNDTEPYAGIAADEKLSLLGTEPFWGIEITGENATYSSPEELNGVAFEVTRFAGNNGLGYSGELEGRAVQIAITPGECSDAMSDRSYPFTATVTWGDTTLYGCGYSNIQSFTGDESP